MNDTKNKNAVNKKITIIHTPNNIEPYYIIDKPAGLPSAPLNECDKKDTAVGQLPVNNNQIPRSGLLHRLDTDTRGLLLVANTNDFYNYMISEQKANRFIKEYIALCQIGDMERLPRGTWNIINGKWQTEVTTRFRNFGKGAVMSIPVTNKDGRAALKKCKNNKLYTTKIRVLQSSTLIEHGKARNLLLIRAQITQGARHQVRSHLAFLEIPVAGDILYNKNCNSRVTCSKNCPQQLNNEGACISSIDSIPMQFFATQINFRLPTGEQKVYSIEDDILEVLLKRYSNDIAK